MSPIHRPGEGDVEGEGEGEQQDDQLGGRRQVPRTPWENESGFVKNTKKTLVFKRFV